MIMSSLSLRIYVEELVAFFTSISPRHPIFPHCMILLIYKVVEPTISLEIVTHVLKV